jgi:hypothetical protein
MGSSYACKLLMMSEWKPLAPGVNGAAVQWFQSKSRQVEGFGDKDLL